MTDGGTNIVLGRISHSALVVAQYIFLGLYLLTLAVVMILYHRSNAVPQYDLPTRCDCRRWSILLLCMSRRIKSIYYLRLFNEATLMLPLYLAM